MTISELTTWCKSPLWESVGHLCKEDQLKDAAFSKMISSEVGNPSSLKDWKELAGYPELLMEIAEQMKKELDKRMEFIMDYNGIRAQ